MGFINYDKKLIKNYIRKHYLVETYDIYLDDITEVEEKYILEVTYTFWDKEGEPFLREIEINMSDLEAFRRKQQTDGMANFLTKETMELFVESATEEIRREPEPDTLIVSPSMYKYLKENNYEKIRGFDYKPYKMPEEVDPKRKPGEKITMREWSKACKKAFRKTATEEHLHSKPSSFLTLQDEFGKQAETSCFEREKSPFVKWIKKLKEENNMRKTIYDVIIIDKKEDKVVEREEYIVAADKTEALSKAGYYKVLEENDHDTKRFEAIITELYDYTSIEED